MTLPAVNLDLSAVDAAVARIGAAPRHLITLLQAIQAAYRYLPVAALRRLAELTGISESEITSVATFYGQFRLRPAGAHTIRVCIGTACHVKGAPALLDAFRSWLRLPADADTDGDGLFTLEAVSCLGCCMLAPAVQIDQTLYGHVTPAQIPVIIGDFLGARAADTTPAATPRRAAAGEVRLCTCSSCAAAGSRKVAAALAQAIATRQLPLRLCEVGCLGASYQAPLVEFATGTTRCRYGRVRPADVETLLERHFLNQTPLAPRLRAGVRRLLERLLVTPDATPPLRFAASVREQEDAAFWLPQQRIATLRAGEDDPLDLEHYRRQGGFAALEARLQAPASAAARADVLATLEDAGLRGRGGGGYPTGRKWAQVAAAAADRPRTVVCNGDEGDPGAFMDRMLLESFPYRILEGALLAAWTVGAGELFFYVRHEYPLAVARLRAALARCQEAGILNAAPAAPGWPPRVEIVEGAGAFVCGEETALLASLEGRRGRPRFRPPYPAESGLFGGPTLINNVETFALIPWLLAHGAAAFRRFGTTASPGTKTFALAGRVARGGLIEVPLGITVREVVEQIGGGMAGGGRLKAVQIGGPSGGCLPAELADTPIDYEALLAAGAMMGSGGLVALDERDCLVDLARYFLTFTQRESCGQCTACRIGTRRLLELLERLCEGRGRAADLEQLERLGMAVARDSLCGLGRTAPNPVLSALRHFRNEFEAHVAGCCPAGKCRALIRYRTTAACIGCTRCAQQCPAGAIPFTPLRQPVIDDARCVRCGTCRQVCPASAIEIVSGKEGACPR